VLAADILEPSFTLDRALGLDESQAARATIRHVTQDTRAPVETGTAGGPSTGSLCAFRLRSPSATRRYSRLSQRIELGPNEPVSSSIDAWRDAINRRRNPEACRQVPEPKFHSRGGLVSQMRKKGPLRSCWLFFRGRTIYPVLVMRLN